MKTLINIFTYIAIVVVIVFGLPKFLSYHLDTPYPMAAITSGSMWPALKEGDLIFIEGTEPEDVKVGDIVVFRNETTGNFIIHRIVKISAGTFVTKGDANFTEDQPVKFENLIGKAFSIKGKNMRIPYLGSITVFANNLKPVRTDNPGGQEKVE